MMIGKGDGASASFVNYQLNGKAGAEADGGANVSEAIRGKTIGERNRDAMDVSKNSIFDTDAYQVDISERAKNWLTYVSGAAAQISSSAGSGWTRTDELAALETSIEQFRRMNENYQSTGSPVDPQEERQRMEAITARFASGNVLDVSATASESGISLAQQDLGQTLKTVAGWEGNAVFTPIYTPVTEIQTQHYRWTEETGIEETVSREEEIAAARADLRQDLENAVTESIEAILTPYDTYEEAYDALYGRQGVAVWSSLAPENLSRVEQLRPVQGAFGTLANHLNNYLEEFGTEDSFYFTLESSLNGLLDEYGENDLVNQIRRMIAASRTGQTIDTASEQFEQEVKDAAAGTYGSAEKPIDAAHEKKTEDESKGTEQGLSFLEMQRRAAEEEGNLLDELLGKEHDRSFESAGDVLKKRNPEDKDTEFTDQLRRVDERVESPQPFAFETEDKGTSTAQPRDGVERLTKIHDAWLSVSEKLMDSFEAEKQGYYEKALKSIIAANVDILA